MGKAVAFVFVVMVALSIILITSGDTDEGNTYPDNEDFRETKDSKKLMKSSHQNGNMEGDEERPVASTASIILNRLTSAPELPHRSYNITNEYLSSSTTPISTVEDSASLLNIKNKKVEALVLSDDPTSVCFCEYLVFDINIVAYTNEKKLMFGDRVGIGDIVFFRCSDVGYHRFRGHRAIQCKGCQTWSLNVFPTCIQPPRPFPVILFNHGINILNNGSLEIQKGQRLKLICVVRKAANHMEWRVPKAFGDSTQRVSTERKIHKGVMSISRFEIQNADDENEGTYQCSLNKVHEAAVHVIVTSPDLLCPEFPVDNSIVVKYEMGRRENSRASFSCPSINQELIGKPELTCLRNGQWSDLPPHCSSNFLK